MTPFHTSVPASQISQNIMPLSSHPLFVHKSVLPGLGSWVVVWSLISDILYGRRNLLP